MPELSEIVGNLEQAIGDALAAYGGLFATKWVMACETMNADGERAVWTVSSSDTIEWEMLGLLNHALQLVKKDYLLQDDDDEGDVQT